LPLSTSGLGIQPRKLEELEGDENPNNNYLVQTLNKIQACRWEIDSNLDNLLGFDKDSI
jgi:hypothetical protein